MRCALPLLFAVVCCAESPHPGDLRVLVRDSLRFVNDDMDRWNFNWRSERKHFDSAGKVTETLTTAGEKLSIDGVPVRRITERNGKALPEDERRQQEARIRQTVERAKADRQRGVKKKPNEHEWVNEVSDALDFKLLGEEKMNGRPAWVLGCSPHPGYEAKTARARVFEKMNGKIWIDKSDRELVRVEAETFDAVNIGMGIFGKVEKGTRFHLNRLRLPDGPWVVDSQGARFNARVLLVKWIRSEIDTRQWSYRRN